MQALSAGPSLVVSSDQKRTFTYSLYALPNHAEFAKLHGKRLGEDCSHEMS